MGSGNGKANVAVDIATGLDVEQELPAGEELGRDVTGDSPAVSDTSELEKLQAERDLLVDRLARLQAEFENARKRTQREQQEFKGYAVADALKSLLPILDSLDRAAKTSAPSVEEFRSGIELIDKQFHDALARLGVEPVPAEGQLFDPNLHEAIQMVETDEAKDNHVLDELQRGYKLKERLLRPAMVRVAKNSAK